MHVTGLCVIGWGCFLFLASCLMAAEYYVSPGGDDVNPGDAVRPWRTLAKAIAVAQPGDIVRVQSGFYNERAQTVRGGTPGARIVFRAEPSAVMRGWVVNHPYVTVQGFDITGHSAANTLDAFVRVNNDAHFFELLNCTVRDGIQAVVTDAVYSSENSTLSSASVNFEELGFAAGQHLYIGMATATIRSTNTGSYQIKAVERSRLMLQGALKDEGPTVVYLSASPVFGLYLATRTEGCLIRSNVFRNLGYDAWLITGHGHVIEDNVVEATGGWDAMHFGGTNHVFRRNVIRNSPLVVYQTSPDAMENYQIPYKDVTFSNNMVINFAGVLSSQKSPYTMSGLYIVRNVFVDVGRFHLTQRETVLEHNTFIRVAKQSYPVVAQAPHPVRVNAALAATNIVIRNNIFVDCGEPSRPSEVNRVGWYEIIGPDESIIREGNFVAGAPPEYSSKVGWTEDARFNGGDPGFVNMDDPLGPDGLPFTADDGLRLRPDSKLLGAGVGGATIGAYELPYIEQIPLEIALSETGDVRIYWRPSIWTWRLEAAAELAGPWTPVRVEPRWDGSGWSVMLPRENAAHWYRLRR